MHQPPLLRPVDAQLRQREIDVGERLVVRLGEQHVRTGFREAIERDRVVDVEVADGGAAELFQMGGDAEGLAEIVRERAHVRAGGGAHTKLCSRSLRRKDLELVHRHTFRLELDLLAFARELVRADTVNFFRRKRRRHLLDLAAELRDVRLEIDAIDALLDRFSGRLARGIVRIGGPAELDRALVRLLHPHQKCLQARGLADAQDEQARRERIERAGVSDFLDLRAAAKPLDDVVRRNSSDLVDEHHAVDALLG